MILWEPGTKWIHRRLAATTRSDLMDELTIEPREVHDMMQKSVKFFCSTAASRGSIRLPTSRGPR